MRPCHSSLLSLVLVAAAAAPDPIDKSVPVQQQKSLAPDVAAHRNAYDPNAITRMVSNSMQHWAPEPGGRSYGVGDLAAIATDSCHTNCHTVAFYGGKFYLEKTGMTLRGRQNLYHGMLHNFLADWCAFPRVTSLYAPPRCLAFTRVRPSCYAGVTAACRSPAQ